MRKKRGLAQLKYISLQIIFTNLVYSTDNMEEQECEVLWMSEALKKRKRDELRLLKRIEEGINYQPTEINTNERDKLFKSNQTSKVVNGKIFEKQSSIDSLKTVNYQPTKMNTNEREKLLENYLRNSAERRRNVLGFFKNNFKVGITEFVSHNQGFSAKMCRFNANFQVYCTKQSILSDN